MLNFSTRKRNLSTFFYFILIAWSEQKRIVFPEIPKYYGSVKCAAHTQCSAEQLEWDVGEGGCSLSIAGAQDICNGHSSYLLNRYSQQIFHIAANRSSINTVQRAYSLFSILNLFTSRLQSRRVLLCCSFELNTNIFVLKSICVYVVYCYFERIWIFEMSKFSSDLCGFLLDFILTLIAQSNFLRGQVESRN